jgi:hypothetical protein
MLYKSYTSEILLGQADWQKLEKLRQFDNARGAGLSTESLLTKGKMGCIVYAQDIKTNKWHINFLAFGPKAADVGKSLEKLKLVVTQPRDRQRLINEIFGPEWEATESNNLPG